MFYPKEIETLFAYTLNTLRKPSAEKLRARHFAFTERNCLDWNRHATMVLLAALILGGIAKALSLPLAAAALTIAVLIGTVEERPGLDTPLWVGRLGLASVAVFYLGLGFALGVASLVVVPALLALHRVVFP